MTDPTPRLTLNLQTSLFFDRQSVLNSHDRAVIDTLKETGALIRKTARQSIKYKPARKRRGTSNRKKRARKSNHASPGQPPFRHVRLGEFGIHKIQFYKDPNRSSVLAGPVTNRKRTKPATEVLEYGGTAAIRGQRARKSGAEKGKRPVRSVRVAARPYMNPALRTVTPKIGPIYKARINKRFRSNPPRPYLIRRVTTRIET